MIGKRRNFPASLVPPHSPVLTMIGASMLWIGWFGFNGGSALGAGNSAGMALLVTHIAAATASLVWMFIEWKRFGRPSLVGIVTGMVAGLATVTPASGFIGVPGGLILGLAGGAGCYLAVDLIRVKLQIDDSLDVFAVHGVGGILGSLLVAFLALPTFGGLGLAEGVSAGAQFMVQLKSVAITVAWTAIASVIILMIVRMFGGLRVDAEVEVEGLDLSEHGERGYHTG
jgi:Amt family ammonium transporter